MAVGFYLSAVVALLATLGVITTNKPIHALLYLVVSLIAVAMIFFCVGAPFAAALEMIVYAGAIMVLFVFAVMVMNLGEDTQLQEKVWLQPRFWIGPAILAGLLMVQLLQMIVGNGLGVIEGATNISPKAVGILLYGPYLLLVELASILLLAALVAAYHLGRADDKN
ncbi:MAG: NADH-quinone oxidoreductase subunit J [Pseudomonadales bacterium]|nr:NADH-quinone oxidoreductase subunit J [Pseudomonadales bacterium]